METGEKIARGTAILLSLPLGGGLGFCLGCFFVWANLVLTDSGGSSHNATYGMIAAGLIGAFIGAVLLPLFVWISTTKNRK